MNKGMLKKIKLLITVVIVLLFVWFLIVSPMITFHNNENKLLEAAKRYYELNSSELPTGERVKTLSLKTLYNKAFIKDDLYIPYTNKTCSIENSWVKVRRENGEYKYYTYLECGVLSSTVDHTGPVITLNGDKEMTLGLDEKYTELGVKSLVDNKDGKLDIKNVEIKGEVDSSKIGTYEITYTAYDNLRNKTEVIREVKVVQKLNSTIKKDLKDAKNYTGNPNNNYIRLSNMIFRIYGLDDNNNVIIVSDEDISNVNYSKLDKWLEYYYDNLNNFTKKIIVDSKYCNMNVKESDLNTKKCTSYTSNKKVYIPSIVEVNKAVLDTDNFMRPHTMSWIANKKNDKNAYATRDYYYDMNTVYMSYDINDNYGVRPMMTIKGDTLIMDGDGTVTTPYIFGDVKKAKSATQLNERYTGEYISIDGNVYRIIKTEADGTTKVIGEFTVGNGENAYIPDGNGKYTYNPKDKYSVGYFVNNKISEYVNTKHFTKHEITVPIYKGKIIYGNEVKNKKYSVLMSAPDMYEMFSAQPQNGNTNSYWLKNTSQKEGIAGAIQEAGNPYNVQKTDNQTIGIRVVAYMKKTTTINNGSGTINDPYVIK